MGHKSARAGAAWKRLAVSAPSPLMLSRCGLLCRSVLLVIKLTRVPRCTRPSSLGEVILLRAPYFASEALEGPG